MQAKDEHKQAPGSIKFRLLASSFACMRHRPRMSCQVRLTLAQAELQHGLPVSSTARQSTNPVRQHNPVLCMVVSIQWWCITHRAQDCGCAARRHAAVRDVADVLPGQALHHVHAGHAAVHEEVGDLGGVVRRGRRREEGCGDATNAA